MPYQYKEIDNTYNPLLFLCLRQSFAVIINTFNTINLSMVLLSLPILQTKELAGTILYVL